MDSLYLIIPLEDGTELSPRLKHILKAILTYEIKTITIHNRERLRRLQGKRLLFAIDIGDHGTNIEYMRMLQVIRSDHSLFKNCIGAVIVDGAGELYTKNIARELVLAANLSGCAFPGRPLVEATGSLENFRVLSRIHKLSLSEMYLRSVHELIHELMRFPLPEDKPVHVPCDEGKGKHDRKRLLVLHASNHKTSNTLRLWEMIKTNLTMLDIREMSLRNGTIIDCSGCPYTLCMHFAEKGQCCYGGVIVEEVFPAVLEADALLMLCPNYNDAISANLTAFVNRLTALFRVNRFYDKCLFGVIVSGYSGGDLLAMQLIGALNMNKSFFLPPRFCMLETANDPESICRVAQIEEKAAAFAQGIMDSLNVSK